MHPNEILSREISATRDEFARGIAAAFPDARPTADGWIVDWEGAQATITLAALPDLHIALLRLARHTCRIELAGPAAHRAALLDRLDRYQHRGGG